ncbi:MAG: MBL fold metallo-hydrolase [Pseudomonadota bacterium]
MSQSSKTKTSTLNAAIIPVTPLQQNCTLIWDVNTMDGAVVDPGGDVDRILEAVTEMKVQPSKVLLTHGHIDHAGGASALSKELNVPIQGPHIADKFLLDGLEAQGREYGFSADNCSPDEWVEEGDKIDIAGHTFEALHCPGHSPGSIVYVNRENKFILMGDVLFRGSIGRTDFPYGDHDALINAIKTKIMPLGDSFAFVCGHGPGSSLALERKTNPFLAS